MARTWGRPAPSRPAVAREALVGLAQHRTDAPHQECATCSSLPPSRRGSAANGRFDPRTKHANPIQGSQSVGKSALTAGRLVRTPKRAYAHAPTRVNPLDRTGRTRRLTRLRTDQSCRSSAPASPPTATSGHPPNRLDCAASRRRSSRAGLSAGGRYRRGLRSRHDHRWAAMSRPRLARRCAVRRAAMPVSDSGPTWRAPPCSAMVTVPGAPLLERARVEP